MTVRATFFDWSSQNGVKFGFTTTPKIEMQYKYSYPPDSCRLSAIKHIAYTSSY